MTKSSQLLFPAFLRKWGVFSAFVLIADGLALFVVVLWPKPEAVTLGGLSLLATFGGLTALCRGTARVHAGQVRRLILLVSVVCGVAFAILALEYRTTAPAFSLASLINVGFLFLAVLAAFLMMRST